MQILSLNYKENMLFLFYVDPVMYISLLSMD